MTPERERGIREWCRVFHVEPNTSDMPDAGVDALHHIAGYVPVLLAELEALRSRAERAERLLRCVPFRSDVIEARLRQHEVLECGGACMSAASGREILRLRAGTEGQPRLSHEDAEPDEQVVETEPPTRQTMRRISDPGLDPRSTKHYTRSKPAAEGQAGLMADDLDSLTLEIARDDPERMLAAFKATLELEIAENNRLRADLQASRLDAGRLRAALEDAASVFRNLWKRLSLIEPEASVEAKEAEDRIVSVLAASSADDALWQTVTEALEFYASAANWIGGISMQAGNMPIWLDQGRRAREALAGTSTDGEGET